VATVVVRVGELERLLCHTGGRLDGVDAKGEAGEAPTTTPVQLGWKVAGHGKLKISFILQVSGFPGFTVIQNWKTRRNPEKPENFFSKFLM
jgi:hypothetical protein